ncbi:hypothetical protein EYF80_024656 [Liparis tanakae]|uniref:Uncharacterized protein n=1 Tax=Liparis tanakae TaxID=230148 RepID=A0A4Z2HH21_9TELE|nr:hypothetical protein EYF80_024656 [Liparis tanakae]
MEDFCSQNEKLMWMVVYWSQERWQCTGPVSAESCISLSWIYPNVIEADGPNFKPKLLVRVPKVSQHDIDDGNLIDFESINLHHSLSVALPRLQQEDTERQRNQSVRAEPRGKPKAFDNFPLVLRRLLMDPPAGTELTIWELWVAELQIFACPGRVVLRAHGSMMAAAASDCTSLERLFLLDDRMGKGWMTSPGGPCSVWWEAV